MPQKSKVLFTAYECAPFYKQGGLGDVAGSLPQALNKLGVDIRVVLPLYHSIKAKFKDLEKIEANIKVKVKNEEFRINIYRSLLPGSRVPIYFIDNKIFDIDDIFNKDSRWRFAFFSYLVAMLPQIIGWKPNIIHANDWQVGLVPALIKKYRHQDKYYKPIKTFYTIHNLAYVGIIKLSVLAKLDLQAKDFTAPKEERINIMKEAILASDLVSTVSPTYAQEILTKEYGYGMTPALRQRRKNLFGIVNGLDYKVFDPHQDKYIKFNYNSANLTDKLKNKLYLQKLTGLQVDKNIPLISLVSRLVSQKGLDLLAEIAPSLMQENLQLIILGTGDERYKNLFTKLQIEHPDKLKVNIKFDIKFASQIYASSDMFLMPSKYEPCGLGQLIAMKYGAVPIVRATGGLKDTIKNYKKFKSNATGFSFKKYQSPDLLKTIKRALAVYNQSQKWLKLQQNIMKQDFSWENSAKKYLKLYQNLNK